MPFISVRSQLQLVASAQYSEAVFHSLTAGIEMYKLYESNMAAVKAGDFSLMADTHAFSSALKSYTTIAAASAIEDCRRACGGHGYSMAGGMASQYTDYLPQVTYEGDSYMLTQQVAKYLMNTFRTLSAQQEKEDPTRASNATTKYMARYLVSKRSACPRPYTMRLGLPRHRRRIKIGRLNFSTAGIATIWTCTSTHSAIAQLTCWIVSSV